MTNWNVKWIECWNCGTFLAEDDDEADRTGNPAVVHSGNRHECGNCGEQLTPMHETPVLVSGLGAIGLDEF